MLASFIQSKHWRTGDVWVAMDTGDARAMYNVICENIPEVPTRLYRCKFDNQSPRCNFIDAIGIFAESHSQMQYILEFRITMSTHNPETSIL